MIGLRLPVALLAVGFVASCGAATPPVASPTASAAAASPARGGTLRVVVPGAPSSAVDASTGLRDQPAMFLDPQLDGWGPGSFSNSIELARCCLARTLLSYNGLSTELGGARLQPDLALALPEVSADGLTWMFRIKPGLHWGPPLETVEITAQDFIRAYLRLFSPTFSTPWAPSASIVGAAEYQAGKAATISGLEAPDDHTLVIRIASPAGDLGAQLASVWSAPVPPNPEDPTARLGIAEGADAGYGHFLVSSGPYMIEGSAALDFAVPAAQRQPPAGLAAGKITLVRNPSWTSAGDALRPAFADRIEVTFADTVEQAVADLDSGAADLVWPAYGPSPSVPAETFAAFQSDAARGRAHLNGTSLVRATVMNLAVPPFDDMHVRKALNLVVDKQRLIELQGGPVAQAVLSHIAPESFEDGLLLSYDPYATVDHRGDLTKAREEMARSKYDSDGDGRCDAAACAHIRTTTRDPYGPVAEALASAAQSIGLVLEVENLGTSFVASTMDPTTKVPLAVGLGFSSFSISAAGLMSGFDSALAFGELDGQEVGNTTMVGATPEQLQRWGYAVTDVPNVDGRIDTCMPLTGEAQFACWAGVDQYLMEYVVPWVPYSRDQYAALTSPRVLTYGFDELVGVTSLDQLALKP